MAVERNKSIVIDIFRQVAYVISSFEEFLRLGSETNIDKIRRCNSGG